MKWRVISKQALHMRLWNDEAILYDARSGDTHLLDSLSSQVLALLRNEDSLTTVALLDQLASLTSPQQRATLATLLETVLDQLASLALIERLQP